MSENELPPETEMPTEPAAAEATVAADAGDEVDESPAAAEVQPSEDPVLTSLADIPENTTVTDREAVAAAIPEPEVVAPPVQPAPEPTTESLSDDDATATPITPSEQHGEGEYSPGYDNLNAAARVLFDANYDELPADRQQVVRDRTRGQA